MLILTSGYFSLKSLTFSSSRKRPYVSSFQLVKTSSICAFPAGFGAAAGTLVAAAVAAAAGAVGAAAGAVVAAGAAVAAAGLVGSAGLGAAAGGTGVGAGGCWQAASSAPVAAAVATPRNRRRLVTRSA